MATQSIFQYYKSEKGLDMCEVALRPLAKAAAQDTIVLGVNFLENFLTLFDMDK
jgi:hypothetical protein